MPRWLGHTLSFAAGCAVTLVVVWALSAAQTARTLVGAGPDPAPRAAPGVPPGQAAVTDPQVPASLKEKLGALTPAERALLKERRQQRKLDKLQLQRQRRARRAAGEPGAPFEDTAAPAP